MDALLNVAAGRTIIFTADGRLMDGKVVLSQQYSAVAARIVVECNESVEEGALLQVPSVSGARNCGQAHPDRQSGRTVVVLRIPYAHIDLATVET